MRCFRKLLLRALMSINRLNADFSIFIVFSSITINHEQSVCNRARRKSVLRSQKLYRREPLPGQKLILSGTSVLPFNYSLQWFLTFYVHPAELQGFWHCTASKTGHPSYTHRLDSRWCGLHTVDWTTIDNESA